MEYRVEHREGSNIRKGENLKIVIFIDFIILSMPLDIAYGVCKPFYHYCPSFVPTSILVVLPTIYNP
jgi:hypothetical protein